MKSQRFNVVAEMGCLECPECQASHLRRSVPGLACFGPSASQSSTNQTANNSQVGVQGGAANSQTVGVGSGNSGQVASGNAIVVNASGTRTNSNTTVNVSTQDAANDALAFSTIDHLITAETSAGGGGGGGGGRGSRSAGSTAVPAAAPVIISTGSNQIPSGDSTSTASTGNLANIGIILGAGLALVAFIHTRGRAT